MGRSKRHALIETNPGKLKTDELDRHIRKCLAACSATEQEYIRLRVQECYTHSEACDRAGMPRHKGLSVYATPLRRVVTAAIDALKTARLREAPFDQHFVLDQYVKTQRAAFATGDYSASRACLRDMATLSGLDPAQRVNVAIEQAEPPSVKDILKIADINSLIETSDNGDK